MMKTKALSAILTLSLLTPLPAFADIAGIQINGDPIESSVLGDEVYSDAGGTTYVRSDFFKRLNLNVKTQDKQITLSNPAGFEMSLTANSNQAILDKKSKTLTAKPQMKNGALYLPLRAVMEAADQTVAWDDKNKGVVLAYDYAGYIRPAELKTADQKAPVLQKEYPKQNQVSGLPAVVTQDGRVLTATTDEDGNCLNLKDGDQVALAPVNTGAYLYENSIQMDKDHAVWTEFTPGGQWHIYEYSPYTNGKAQELASGTMLSTEGSPQILGAISATPKKIAYLFIDDKNSDKQLVLYDRVQKEKTVLATFGASDSVSSPSMDGHLLVWSEGKVDSYMRFYNTIYVYDLNTKTKTALNPGCNLGVPMVRGKHLIALKQWEGMNFVERPDGTSDGTEIWHYDLEKQKWDWRISTRNPIFKDGAHTVNQLTIPQFIGANHLTFRYISLTDVAITPIVDLNNQTLSALKNKDGKDYTENLKNYIYIKANPMSNTFATFSRHLDENDHAAFNADVFKFE